ncbi:acyl-CoA dehydrogenase family protein [Neobacillus mesonae]|uniref:acyl-CoA dehydrogenase family protein n=1 Tax=Neobacillus mesonae TaxID=1193713 RepID=UPI00203E6A56|nr:acyl-CoA dehydrogenase family protein [Neobacillus mesonae]MCM3568236.1 acyl-CoA dehydrogenase family protein [Neobacillus mesonae]
MTYQLTQDQVALWEHVYHLGKRYVEPHASKWDQNSEYPWAIHEILKEQLLFGALVPKEYGGLGLSVVDFTVILEAIASSSACGATLGTLETHSLGAQPILIAGTEEQKRRWLPQIASGDSLCAFSLTESGAGSDAGSITTRAVKDGDSYVINGSKVFCTLGNLARYVTVFAKTQQDVGTRGITAFVIDTQKAPGFKVGRVEKKMGLRGSPTVELIYEDVRVPVENRLGNEGEGFKIAMETLSKGRVAVAADSVGIMDYVTKYAADYAKTRTQFGRPLSNLQAIQFMLADMEIQTETARQMTYAAANALISGEKTRSEIARLTAIAKCYATDVRQKVVSDAIQILGGYGYMQDYPLERIHRDSKIYQIFEGTNQIQRLVIARSVLAKEK